MLCMLGFRMRYRGEMKKEHTLGSGSNDDALYVEPEGKGMCRDLYHYEGRPRFSINTASRVITLCVAS